jgi:AcrR family transcriptional regulator
LQTDSVYDIPKLTNKSVFQEVKTLTDTFNSISAEKRDRIINAALEVFAENGYRKTSAADVANHAGISKAMIFSYFGSKQGMYEFLCEYAIQISWEEFRNNAHKLLTDDYFKRIRLSVDIKLAIMKRYHAMLLFLTSMYFEKDSAVRPKIESLLGESFDLRDELLLQGIDATRFRDGVDVVQITKMLTWMATGMAEEWKGKSIEKLDELVDAFYQIIEMLKRNLYKEENL